MTFEEAQAIAWNKARSEKGSMWMPSSFEIEKIHTEAAELYATAKAAQETEKLKRELKASSAYISAIETDYAKCASALIDSKAEINSKAAQAWEEGCEAQLKRAMSYYGIFPGQAALPCPKPTNPYLPKHEK